MTRRTPAHFECFSAVNTSSTTRNFILATFLQHDSQTRRVHNSSLKTRTTSSPSLMFPPSSRSTPHSTATVTTSPPCPSTCRAAGLITTAAASLHGLTMRKTSYILGCFVLIKIGGSVYLRGGSGNGTGFAFHPTDGVHKFEGRF